MSRCTQPAAQQTSRRGRVASPGPRPRQGRGAAWQATAPACGPHASRTRRKGRGRLGCTRHQAGRSALAPPPRRPVRRRPSHSSWASMARFLRMLARLGRSSPPAVRRSRACSSRLHAVVGHHGGDGVAIELRPTPSRPGTGRVALAPAGRHSRGRRRPLTSITRAVALSWLPASSAAWASASAPGTPPAQQPRAMSRVRSTPGCHRWSAASGHRCAVRPWLWSRWQLVEAHGARGEARKVGAALQAVVLRELQAGTARAAARFGCRPRGRWYSAGPAPLAVSVHRAWRRESRRL